MDRTIMVATAGQGILRSNDEGNSWHRLGLKEAIEFDGTVRALAVDIADPHRIYAGADVGMCISDDGGAHWRLARGATEGMTIWSIACDPSNPNRLFAGSGAPSRARLFRSDDRGETWVRLPVEIPEFCAGVNRPRILTICVDPQDSQDVWFGVEEGGAWRSRDGGDNWTRLHEGAGGINNSDLHGIFVLSAGEGRQRTNIALTVNAVCRSVDDGQSWTHTLSKDRFNGLYYTRTLAVMDGGATIALAIGDGTPGRISEIQLSNDAGETWTTASMDQAPNSTFWAFGQHPADERLLFAGTKYGDLFRSNDGGRNWTKEWRVFSEITAVAWTPVRAPIHAHAQSKE